MARRFDISAASTRTQPGVARLRRGPTRAIAHDARFQCAVRAFTLIELLVSLSIIALLLAILMPALASARNEARAFVCMDHLRAATFDFRLFADAKTASYRGDSETQFGSGFDAMDFQESLYETSEFWNAGDALKFKRQAYRRGQRPIICPAGPTGLYRVHGVPDLLAGAVAPKEKVSYAMNRRLRYAPVRLPDVPFPLEQFVAISQRIMNHPHVPVMFDVDAAAAIAARRDPFFSAPAPRKPGQASVYDDDRYWFPSRRHNGRLTVGFVGGHVVSTKKPLADMIWDWEYHPQVGNR